jgi:hypothetical protein
MWQNKKVIRIVKALFPLLLLIFAFTVLFVLSIVIPSGSGYMAVVIGK